MPITVSKAIEILVDTSKSAIALFDQDRKDAIELGIEALSRHQRALKGFTHPEKHLLPGETPEEEVEVDKTRL